MILSNLPIIFALIWSADWLRHLLLMFGNSFLISSDGILSSGLNIKYTSLNTWKLFIDGLFGFLNFSKSSFLMFSAFDLAFTLAGSASARALSASAFSCSACADAACASAVASSTIFFSPDIFSFSTSNTASTSFVFFCSASTSTDFFSILSLSTAMDWDAFATTCKPFSKRAIWFSMSPSFLVISNSKYFTSSKNDLGVV